MYKKKQNRNMVFESETPRTIRVLYGCICLGNSPKVSDYSTLACA